MFRRENKELIEAVFKESVRLTRSVGYSDWCISPQMAETEGQADGPQRRELEL